MEIKKIILNGCSFVNGCDIFYEKYNIASHAPLGIIWEKYLTDAQKSDIKNTMTLGGKLKNAFKCDLVDMSVPGWSNDNIAKKTIDYIYKNLDSIDTISTLVVIGWTENYRFPFIHDGNSLNASAFHVESYIRHMISMKNDLPENDQTPDRLKAYASNIEFYNKLRGWGEVWKNDDMSIIGYSHHISLILLLQWFLEKHNIKYCFFNSLPVMSILEDKDDGNIYPTDYLVDWQNWYPWKNKNSYSNFSWFELIKNKSNNITKTYHPTVDGLEIFSSKLIDFIKINY